MKQLSHCLCAPEHASVIKTMQVVFPWELKMRKKTGFTKKAN